MAPTYAKLEGKLDFDSYIQKVKQGRSYVTEGRSHLIDFSVNGLEMGTHDSELALAYPQKVVIVAKAVAYLPENQDEIGKLIASRPQDQPPYWHLERARIGKSRRVSVELIVNGQAVERRKIMAGGGWTDIAFQYPIQYSSWVALRILPSSHTNPVFVVVDGKPVRPSKRSAEWCRQAVDRCWEMKHAEIRTKERPAAKAAYGKARQVYDQIIRECPDTIPW